MKHILLPLLLLASLLAAPAAAQPGSWVQFPNGWAPGTSPCTKQVDGTCVPVSAAAPLPVTSPATTESGTAAQTVQGAETSGTTAAARPIGIGCVASAVGLTAVTAGQRVNAACGTDGLALGAYASNYAPNDASGDPGAGLFSWNGYRSVSALWVRPQVFNGTSYDKMRGDTNGSWVVTRGSSNIATAQVSVGTSVTSLVAARAGRARVIVSVGAANSCFIGPSGVTALTGFALPATAGATFTVTSNAQVYAVCGAATILSVLEEY